MSKINMEAIEYIRNIPPPFRAIVEEIRRVIFNTIPDIKENFKYNMPIYEKNGEICYIQKKLNQHVKFGFFKGNDLKDPDQILEGTDDEKKYVLITCSSDIVEKKVSNLLEEATQLIKKN